MKTLILVLSFLSLLFMSFASHAQDVVPWPPDPKTIFADGVEVVDTEIITRPPMPANAYPVADDQTRIVRVYDQDTGMWREYPYPAAATSLSKRIQVRSDGTILFNNYGRDTPPADWPEMWILNPQTNQFSRAEIVCGGIVKDLPNEGNWVFRVGRDHLCFTETGEESSALPDNVGWVTAYGPSTPSLSPDGKWLAVQGVITHAQDNSGHLVIYSYEIATKKLNYLGEADSPDNPFGDASYFDKWVSNTQGTLVSGPPQESLSNNYFTFDVTKPNSLHLIVSGWMYDYYDNPPRYEYPTTTAFWEWKSGSEVSPHIPCEFTLYDALGVHTFELGYDCIFARVLRAEDRYFYVRVDSDPSTTSTLVYLDTKTGKTTDLFSGEIESIESVSPDRRYVVLVMDGSGQVDQVNRFADYMSWGGIPNAYLVIWDLQNQRIVYRIESPPNYVLSDYYLDAGWLNQNIVALNDTDGSGQLVNLDTDPPVSMPFNSYYRPLSPDGQRLFLDTTDETGKKVLSVINPSTGEAKTVIYQDALLGYIRDVNWVGDNLISIRLTPDLGNKADPSRSATYTFRVPEFDG